MKKIVIKTTFVNNYKYILIINVIILFSNLNVKSYKKKIIKILLLWKIHTHTPNFR